MRRSSPGVRGLDSRSRRAVKPIASSQETFRPLLGDGVAHHGLQHPVRVRGVAEGEPAFTHEWPSFAPPSL